MNKPEFLFSKEVLSFENYTRHYIAGLISIDVDPFYKALEFYTQPFTPNLIVELFEGWEGDERNLYNGACHVLFFPLSNCMVIGYYRFPMPKTLSQFIAYCDAANIHLQWKSGE